MNRILDTHSFTVRPSDCDFLGHMNIARYFDACSDAGFSLQSCWSLTLDDVLKGRQIAFVVVKAETNFIQELRIGDHVRVRSNLNKIGGKSIAITHHFLRDGKDVFVSMFTLVLMSLKTREAITIPDPLRDSIIAAHA